LLCSFSPETDPSVLERDPDLDAAVAGLRLKPSVIVLDHINGPSAVLTPDFGSHSLSIAPQVEPIREMWPPCQNTA